MLTAMQLYDAADTTILLQGIVGPATAAGHWFMLTVIRH